MVKDRMFFDPGPLAFGKGVAYLFAFLTTVFFVKVNERAYIFGIFAYSCGVVCDYMELSLYRKDKCKFVRNIATTLSVLLIIVAVVALSAAMAYELIPKIEEILQKCFLGINIFLTAYWALPLLSGIWLWYKNVNSDEVVEHKEKRKAVSGYYIKP